MQSVILDPLISLNDDMPLNATDKAWITLEIQNALKRKGWGKLTGFLKDWSGAGAAITILVLFFTQWTGYIEFRTKTGDRLDAIEKILPQISASLELLKPHAGNTLPQVMKDAINNKSDRKIGLNTVAALATQAKEQGIAANPKEIAEVGHELTTIPALFTPQHSQSDDAWEALTGLLNYSSFLTTYSFGPLQPLPFGYSGYDFGGTEGKTFNVTVTYTGGMVPVAEAARGEHIIGPPQQFPSTLAPKTVVVQGKLEQFIILDQHHLKNIVFVNMSIEYSGGPVILDNVTFVNCVFHLARRPQCVDFGKSVFASTSTTFTNGG